MADDPLKPRAFDFLARWMAWGTFRVPRISPMRFAAEANRRRADDLPSEWFKVKADDGIELDAVRFPARRHGDEPTGEAGPRLPVIFNHGWTETKEFHFRLPRLLAPQGHDVILFDQRCHGRSGGRYSTLGVMERHDLRAVIDACAARGWVRDRVITMGVSMGGASVLMSAATDARVAGVVAYAPFVSFLGAIRSYRRRYLRLLSEEWGVRGFVQMSKRVGFDIRESAPIDVISRVQAPVLFIVGKCDVNLPACDHAQVLADALGPLRGELVQVEHANHFNIVSEPWPEADAALLRFLSRVH